VLVIIASVAGCTSPRPFPVPTPPKVTYDSLITSRPDAIRCNVNGATGKSVTVTTPRLVPLSKLGAPIVVRCLAPGYWNHQTTIIAGSRKPLLERAISGEQVSPSNASVRGPDVGPGGEFPREITVTLRRDAFDSAAERDLYYAEHIQKISLEWAGLIETAKAECSDERLSQKGRSSVSPPNVCRDGLLWLEALKRADLQLAEQQRRRSRIP
jgi:hypothetical protein